MATDSRGYSAGIVIGEHAIAILEMAVQRGKSEITARAAVDTPVGSVDGAAIVDPARVAQAIKNLRREAGMKFGLATVTMDSPGYAMRTVRLPDVPAREQRMLVRGELEQVGVLPVGTGGLDFIWLPAPTTEGRKQADAAAYYTSDANVDAIRITLRQAGLEVGGIEPSSLSTMRAAVTGLEDRRPMALLYVAKKHSDLLIHDGSIVRHVRRIPAGWDEEGRQDATTAPLGSLGEPEQPRPPSGPFPPGAGLSFELPEGESETAQAYAPAYARSGSAEGYSGPGGDTGNGLQAATVPFLAAEVGRSIAFYAREYSTAPQPEVLVVLGAHIGVSQVRSTLADYLSIPVDTRDILGTYPLPVPAGPAADAVDNSVWLSALGAAFSDAEAVIPAVDVGKQETIAAARRRAPGVLLAGMAASTIWMLATVAASLVLTFLEGGAAQEMATLEGEIKRINDERAPLLREYSIAEAVKIASEKSRVPASSILGRIAAATTPGVGVTSIKVGLDGKVQVDGEATSTESMDTFARNMNLGRSIKQPYLETFRKDGRVGITFRMTGFYRGASAATEGGGS